jgi:hypothetical protein
MDDDPAANLDNQNSSESVPDTNMKNMSGMNVPKTPSTSTANKVIYTCRMHPEVQQDHPGKCPKCGMTLVPKKSGDPQ